MERSTQDGIGMANPGDTNELLRLASLIPNYRWQNQNFDEIISRSPSDARLWYRILTGQSWRDSSQEKIATQPPVTSATIEKRWVNAKRLLNEYAGGATSDSDSRKIWEVDPIPLVIDGPQWQILAKGIAQRARLLDLILRDVYGPQTLLARGLLPHELLYGTDTFLRSMCGTVPQGQPMLTLYAAQLCRDASGTWYVMADRTQGPSGGGYSVENRIAVSRVFPEEFRDLHVQRSAPFFAALRDSISRMSTSKGEVTRTVLLSPGIRSSTYFEDAYLARYLGYTLAQSDDLTVRNGQVFLKTLGGLVRVSTVLRRVPDLECDPLELAASAIGVPGLCQSTRDHQVSMANHLGSGWAEIPALMAILPRLCHEMLGEELLLPSWPTWWCGEPGSRQYVTSNLQNLVLRDAFVRHSGSKWLGYQISPERLQALHDTPWSIVASASPAYSTAPCWINNEVVAWPLAMRVFATAVDGDYQVLSGGIARVAESPEKLTESLASGTMSKDVWVLGDGPVKPITLRRPPQRSVELRRSSYDLPSRVAEHLFWLGRWTERCEGMIRHARFCVNRLSGEIDTELLPVWFYVVEALEDIEQIDPSKIPPTELLARMRKQLVNFVFDEGNLSSLAAALVGVRRNATMIRDRLSLDSWQILSRLDLEVLFPYSEDRRRLSDIQLLLNQMLNYLTAFAGLVAESMTRGPGWQFLDIGRRIERSQGQLRLIEKLLVPVYPRLSPILESMLDIMDSSMTYRYRYLMNFEIGPVLDLLMVDQTNPRATAFQFAQLDDHLRLLIGIDRSGLALQRKHIQECRALLRLADIDDIAIVRPFGETIGSELRKPPMENREGVMAERRPELSRLVTTLSDVVSELSEHIAERFFTHTAVVRQLGEATTQ